MAGKKTAAENTRTSGMHVLRSVLTEKRIKRIMSIVLVAALAVFGVYEVYTLRQNPVHTFTALEETVSDTVAGEAFILRDEQCIDVSISGYTVPFVQDGERVESDAAIAARFPDAGSAQRYAQLQEMRNEYARYLALSTGREYSVMKVQTLMKKAADGVCAFLQQADSGRIFESKESESDYLDRETALEIAVSGSIDLTDKLAKLSQDIQAQEQTVGTYETIRTGVKAGGYFFSTTDGYEDTLSFAEAESLTPAQLEKALKAEPSKSKGCKIVKSHAWYIVTEVNAQTADTLSSMQGKSKVRIHFPQSGVQDVYTSVYAICKQADNRCVAVFRCIEVSDALLRLRKAAVDIVLGEKTGFRIPVQAVRVLEQGGESVRGVYVLRGNIVTFRKLNSVYTGEDFVISAPTADSGYIRLYDEIITGGKNLYDGALIY